MGLCGPHLRISGAVGNIASSRKGGSTAAETEIGEGQTSEWTAGALDDKSTVAFFFEVASQAIAARSTQGRGKRR